MTTPDLPDCARAIRETTHGALAMLDTMISKLELSPSDPVAAVMEVQREIFLSLGKISELVAEVGEHQNSALMSPEFRDALKDGAKLGADTGFKDVAREMRRRSMVHAFILGVGVAVLGGISFATGFTMGTKHEIRTIVLDCLRDGAQLTPEGDRVCAVLMSPRPRATEPDGSQL